MRNSTLYTAIGHFQRRQTQSGRYPVILINQKEYMVDVQEMVLWTCLNWRIQDLDQLRAVYDNTAKDVAHTFTRSFEECVHRLTTRGLVVSGTGETGFEALYDLVSTLYVVPVSSSRPLRLLTFFKLIFRNHVPYRKARILFQKDKPNEDERRVLGLSRQALLSTAEIIKCVETGTYDVSTDDAILDALYDDEDTTSRNIGWQMKVSAKREQVTLAVANLYLRKQIIFQRVGL